MAVFRACPMYPGYSAALCGAIRRDEWCGVTKLGRIRRWPAAVVRPIGVRREHVLVAGRRVASRTLVADAWPRPMLSIAEWRQAWRTLAAPSDDNRLRPRVVQAAT